MSVFSPPSFLLHALNQTLLTHTHYPICMCASCKFSCLTDGTFKTPEPLENTQQQTHRAKDQAAILSTNYSCVFLCVCVSYLRCTLQPIWVLIKEHTCLSVCQEAADRCFFFVFLFRSAMRPEPRSSAILLTGNKKTAHVQVQNPESKSDILQKRSLLSGFSCLG